jgi:hypothetical protein
MNTSYGVSRSPTTPSGVAEQLVPNQPPLGTQFKSYELTKAINYYVLDPFQYSITKFDYNLPGFDDVSSCVKVDQKDFKNDPGLVYKDVNFEKLLPAYTSTLKSVNDFPAQSYHRFEANDGYFNPNEANDNTDLWYYGAARNEMQNYLGGAPLNVQEVNHIIFSEPQRGGTNTKNLAKYSWVNTPKPNQFDSWESKNQKSINNNKNCEFFNYNNHYTNNYSVSENKVYSFDSEYCRKIGISSPDSGSMPFVK